MRFFRSGGNQLTNHRTKHIAPGTFPACSPSNQLRRKNDKMPTLALSASARLLTLLCLTCFILSGCPARKPILSTTPAFHLKSLKESSLVLSPNVPAQQPLDAPVSFTLAANNESPASPNACVITQGLFRLEPDAANKMLRIVLPPPNEWLFGSTNSSRADESDIIDSLYSFLAATDQADRAGCFADKNTSAHDYILQNIPTRPSDSLFNAYGYRIERSGVNLKPNLRLKVERAYFSSAEKSVKDYLGISTVFFDVTTTSDGSLHFQQAQPIRYNPDSLSQTDHEGSRDLTLLDLKPQKFYRVLFYTHQVPTDRNFSAALIGANDTARLDSFEQVIRSASDADCSSLKHDGVECFEFRGFVTVSIQIPIELNGKTQFVDWGTKVEAVVPAKAQKSFKLQRQFVGSYYDLKFNQRDDNILDLTLVGGDRLSW